MSGQSTHLAHCACQMLDIIGNFKEMVGMKRLEEKGRRGIMKIEERRGWKRKTNGEEFVRGKFN